MLHKYKQLNVLYSMQITVGNYFNKNNYILNFLFIFLWNINSPNKMNASSLSSSSSRPSENIILKHKPEKSKSSKPRYIIWINMCGLTLYLVLHFALGWRSKTPNKETVKNWKVESLFKSPREERAIILKMRSAPHSKFH